MWLEKFKWIKYWKNINVKLRINIYFYYYFRNLMKIIKFINKCLISFYFSNKIYINLISNLNYIIIILIFFVTKII